MRLLGELFIIFVASLLGAFMAGSLAWLLMVIWS